MDISTQTALCQMSAPMGVGADDPFPCSLCWLPPGGGSNSGSGGGSRDLLIGWADSFRQVRIAGGGNNNSDGSGGGAAAAKVATIVAEWMTDSIICGLQSCDDDHVVFIGYTPPSEDEV